MLKHLLIIIILLSASVCYATDADFSMVVFPDTQKMVQTYPDIWQSMPDWVVANKTTENIQAVIGVGDVVNIANATQFSEAVTGWDKIKNADIVYIPVIGNHDYTDVTNRATPWNTYFGEAYFSGKSWYGDSYQDSTENYYVLFSVGSRDFLVFALELIPRSVVLTWAQGIIDANPDREIIIVTHSYLNTNGSRTLDASDLGANYLGLSADNNAEEMWTSFIKTNSAIKLVICGHQPAGVQHSLAVNNNGDVVNQLLIDLQTESNGGNGYFMILTFKDNPRQIITRVYSSYLSTTYAQGVFTLPNSFKFTSVLGSAGGTIK